MLKYNNLYVLTFTIFHKRIIKTLPMIIAGTPNYPIDTYDKVVGLEKYDTFLILSSGRFTENDLLLAKKVRAMEKSFFFVRTKIDQDLRNERRKRGFNEDATLSDIRGNCLENLTDFIANDEVVFLISNHETTKWDYKRLNEAILDSLPARQKQTLTLALDLLTTQSKDFLARKVEILRGSYKVQPFFAIKNYLSLSSQHSHSRHLKSIKLQGSVDYPT